MADADAKISTGIPERRRLGSTRPFRPQRDVAGEAEAADLGTRPSPCSRSADISTGGSMGRSHRQTPARSARGHEKREPFYV